MGAADMSEIHFPLAPDHDQPKILKGATHFSSLPAVFCVHATGQYQGPGRVIYQTDVASLVELAQAARAASAEVNDTVAAIGLLGAYSQFENIGEHAASALMWSLVRLAELREAIDKAASDFDWALQQGHHLHDSTKPQCAAESEGAA